MGGRSSYCNSMKEKGAHRLEKLHQHHAFPLLCDQLFEEFYVQKLSTDSKRGLKKRLRKKCF